MFTGEGEMRQMDGHKQVGDDRSEVMKTGGQPGRKSLLDLSSMTLS